MFDIIDISKVKYWHEKKFLWNLASLKRNLTLKAARPE